MRCAGVFALPGPHAPEELIPRGLHGVQLGVVRPFVANAANLIRSMLHPSERGAANEHLPACTGIGDHCSSRRGVRAGEGCEDVREKVEVEVPAPTHQRPLQQQECVRAGAWRDGEGGDRCLRPHQRPLLCHTPASHFAFSRMADPAGTPPFGSWPVATPMRTRRPEAGT